MRTPAPNKGGKPAKASASGKRSATTQQAKLERAAAAHGLVLEEGSNKRWRLVDAATGTLVAADWQSPTGFGLSLDEIEAALAGLE